MTKFDGQTFRAEVIFPDGKGLFFHNCRNVSGGISGFPSAVGGEAVFIPDVTFVRTDIGMFFVDGGRGVEEEYRIYHTKRAFRYTPELKALKKAVFKS